MLEGFDEDARAVFACAQEEVLTLGRECVGTEHVLLGVCCQDARDSDPVLAPAGVTAQSVRAWLAQHGDRGGGAPDPSLPFTPNVRFVLYQTHVEAGGRQHQFIGRAHVLLALIRCAIVAPDAAAPAAGAPRARPEDALQLVPPGAGHKPVQNSPAGPDVVAALLRDQGIDLGALHARAAARANTTSAGQGFPFLGEDLAARRCLPGSGRRWLWRAAVLAGYAPLAAVTIVLAPPATRVIALAFAVIAPVVLSLVMGAVAWPLWRRRLAGADVEAIEAPGLRAALAPAGLREVKVFCDLRGRFTGRSRGAARRFGKVGLIFLRPSLKKAHPDVTRFITAHEAAHLARDDVMSEGLAVACLATLVGVAVATRPADVLWLFVPALALIVALRWCQELACDRIAAYAAGPIPARVHRPSRPGRRQTPQPPFPAANQGTANGPAYPSAPSPAAQRPRADYRDAPGQTRLRRGIPAMRTRARLTYVRAAACPQALNCVICARRIAASGHAEPAIGPRTLRNGRDAASHPPAGTPREIRPIVRRGGRR